MAGRVVGVDMARCLALLGMMATHILPTFVDGEVPDVDRVASGRSAALFATLAGTSLVLAHGRRSPLRGRRLAPALASITVRAVLIGALGLLLGGAESGIAVILTSYAAFFLVAMWFLPLGTRGLLAVGLTWLVAGPVVSHVLRSELPGPTYDVPSPSSLEAPGVLLRELVLTGYYPALTWMPYLLVGMALGRLDLRSSRTATRLLAAGATAVAGAWLVSSWLLGREGARSALVRTFDGAGWRGDLDTTLESGLYGVTPTGSWWWLAVRAPHSGTTPDLLMTLGSALLVLAVCLVVGRAAPAVVRVLFGAGAMTLTLYTLHVVSRRQGWWDGEDLTTYLGQAGVALAVGAAYALAHRRGPLEELVGRASDGAARLARGRRSGEGRG